MVHVPSLLPSEVKRLIRSLQLLNAQNLEDKMPSKKPRITVYLTPEEHAEISASAARAGISFSKFAKLVCTGMAVPTLEHKQAVQEIIKARADLGSGLINCYGLKSRLFVCAAARHYEDCDESTFLSYV